MGHFHIELIHFCIVEGGIDFDVAEDALNLFYWHPFVYCHRGEGPAELVRMDIVQPNALAYCPEADLNPAYC